MKASRSILRQFSAVSAAGILAASGAVPTNPAVGQLTPANAWEKPLFKWADTTRLGRPCSKDPSVVRFGNRYLMYFSLPPFAKEMGPTNAPGGWSIGIAASRNLLDWAKVAELWPAQACDKNGLCAPCARVINGKVHLFYQTYGNGPKDAICHAFSTAGV
jgi:hypothetical protein